MTSKKSQREKWMIILPLAAGAVAYLVFVFLPCQRTAAELQSKLREKQEYLTYAGSVGTALAASEEELQAARHYRDQRLARAPSITHVSDVFAKIHCVERESGVHTVRFDPQPLEAKQYVSIMPLSVECMGSFFQVCSLLRGLENLPADIWVRKLRLEKMSAPGENIQCWIDLAIFADNQDKSDYVEKSN